MNDLLKLMLDAHGGLETWSRFTKIDVDISNTGLMLKMKGWEHILTNEALRNVHVTADTRQQRISLSPFNAVGLRCSYKPGVVAVETLSGETITQRENPWKAFEGHTLETKWDELHLAYFRCYAMWNYLNAPFMFVQPGFKVEEIEPWSDRGVMRRRLKVTFPDHIATHCPEQIFHVDQNGLLARLDYRNLILGTAGPTAHYVFEYREFQGIKIPIKRLAFRQDAQGNPMPEPIVMEINIANVVLT